MVPNQTSFPFAILAAVHMPMYIPKVERHKLDHKARKCVILGYGTAQKGIVCMTLLI